MKHLALITLAYICLFSTSVIGGQSTTVLFHFIDSSLVNDSIITIRDIAQVQCSSIELENQIENVIVGQAAPPGFSRFVNTTDLITYNLQSKYKDVQFKSEGAGRIVVKTDCETKSVGDYSKEIVEYLRLTLAWKPDQCLITIATPEASWKILKGPVQIEVAGLTNTKAKGRVSLLLKASQGSKQYRIPFLCDINVNVPVVVLTTDVARGEIITADKCELKKMDVTHYGPTPFTSINEIHGMVSTRAITAGTIMYDNLCKAVPAVSKGDFVKILASSGRVKVSVEGVAREAGELGKVIWVENSFSHKLIRAKIRDRMTVEIASSGDAI